MMLSLWQRLPVVVRAVLAGVIVSTAGLVPWVFFSTLNQKFLLSVPWAVLPTTLFLWFFWRYLGGAGWPRATSEARRTSLRANSLSADVWAMAIFAGLLGLTALLPLMGILSRMVSLPAEAQPIRVPEGMPFITVFFLLVMASIVAGVVEEAAFRGYLQGPIERRHSPVVAILLTGVLFGLGHFTHHPQSVLAMMPYYVAIAAVYGGLACLTNSILPGLVLHAGGDVLVLNRLWITGKPEWQMAPAPTQLIWEAGPDAAFWGYLVAFTLVATAAVGAYVSLAALVRKERGVGAQHHAAARAV